MRWLALLPPLLALPVGPAFAVEPRVANLNFDTRLDKPGGFAEVEVPGWISGVSQRGGRFLQEPRCWHVDAVQPQGIGQLVVSIDREKMKENLAATVLFDAGNTADIAVQLVDREGRVVVVDLFGNLADVGREATTETFIVPLRKYPTAEKIVLRRITGEVKVYGIVLFPVVMEGEAVPEAIQELARVLGDPLSPENPLVKGLKSIAQNGNVTLAEPEKGRKASAIETPGALPRPIYPAAKMSGAAGSKVQVSSEGLVAHWNFNGGDARDESGRGHHGRAHGNPEAADGVSGKGLRLRAGKRQAVLVPGSPEFGLKDAMTVSAWIRFDSIAPGWGSQIVWFGDERKGRDPWLIHLYPDGTLEFRSDRTVTGKAVFRTFQNEIEIQPGGKSMHTQQVSVQSPGTLAPGAWYFVAATIEKVSPRVRALNLYVNGAPVGQVKTEEAVDYDMSPMWVALGAVDSNNPSYPYQHQYFDGVMDEVRVYQRTLSTAEIQGLYQQPLK